jgi:hypothetical protein
MTAPLTACPHCGGTSGYGYETKVLMGGNWGEEPETVGDRAGVPDPKSVRCLDCGERVAMKRARGE